MTLRLCGYKVLSFFKVTGTPSLRIAALERGANSHRR
jgi:hypothetical protein